MTSRGDQQRTQVKKISIEGHAPAPEGNAATNKTLSDAARRPSWPTSSEEKQSSAARLSAKGWGSKTARPERHAGRRKETMRVDFLVMEQDVAEEGRESIRAQRAKET
jgi:hypothetical protein